MTTPAVVVTGASSGIGRALAELAAADGPVMLLARSLPGLEETASAIEAKGGKAHIALIDLGLSGAGDALLEALEARGLHCDVLINNAGFGLVGLAAELPRSRQIAMVDLNVRAVTDLALAVLPGMLARRRGGILNVASVASFLPGPRMAVYYASKAYVQSFSESLRAEARAQGVTITSLCPGPVTTDFLARAIGRERAEALGESPFHVPLDEVARAGWNGFKRGKATVIPGRANQLIVFAARFTPRGLTARAVGRRQARRTEG
jgi:uncharacterized protein